MTLPTGSPISLADADGDVGSLSDVIGGSGVLDSNEASEGDEQITNVGGKGEDLRPLTALHSGAVGTSASTQPQLLTAAGASVFGLVLPAAGGGALAGGGFGALIGGVVASYFAVREEASSLVAERTQTQIQQDPFDPNYKQVYAPVFLPPTAGMPDLPASLPAAKAAVLRSDLTASLTATGNVAAYSQAVYVTQNRLFSAYQSGDLNSFDLQNRALTTDVAALASSETAEARADTALAGELATDNGDATITQANTASFQSGLKAQGFAALPAAEQSIIKTYLPNPVDQQALVNQMAQLDPSTVSTSFVTQLQDQASVADAIGSALAIPPLTNTTVPLLKFSVLDVTTGQTSGSNGTPLPGGGTLFAAITADSLAITANVPSAFIQSGTGNDILSATQGGNNVLDDMGGQVNFELGSGNTGTDTFFLDTRHDPVSWNTIANFHAGDAAIIYGIAPQDLTTSAANGLGVPAYQGLTLRTFQGGGAAFLTLAGYSTADLSNGRLAAATGTAPDGSSFLLVQGM